MVFLRVIWGSVAGFVAAEFYRTVGHTHTHTHNWSVLGIARV